MNESPYFCCGNLPSEGHTGACRSEDAEDRRAEEEEEDESLVWAAEGEAAQHPRERW